MFQPLREQAQAGSVPEGDLDEVGLAASEDKEVAGGILLQHLLDQQGQPVHPCMSV
jgi:hypothetical protein